MQAYEIDIALSRTLAASGIVVDKDINHTFHGSGSDARAAWDSFKVVAHEPPQPWLEDDGRRIEFGHEDEDDLVLFRADVDEIWSEAPWMLNAPPRPSVLRLTFVRRIWSGPEPDRNSTRFELHLVLEFSLSPQLQDLAAANEKVKRAPETPSWVSPGETWGYGPGGNSSKLPTLSQWVTNVEASDSFNAAFDQGAIAFHFWAIADDD
jgi:hypothetical protein